MRDYTKKIEQTNCQLVTDYKFKLPCGIAIGPSGQVVVADSKNGEVVIFDKNDENLKCVGTFGRDSGDNGLCSPENVAVRLNVIAVSDHQNHVVKIFSLRGDYLTKFGSRGSGDGQFNNPQGLCFNSKGLLYVVDHDNYRVQVFRENLFQKNVFLFKFGSKGRNPGQLQCPRKIAVNSSDQVYVTDQSLACSVGGIKVFSEDGYFIKKIGCFNSHAICIAPDNHIIHSIGFGILSVFSPTHEEINSEFSEHGNAVGQFETINGIAMDTDGTIFVTEDHTYRLQIITPHKTYSQ